MTRYLLAGAALVVLVAAPAKAAVTVIGNGMAHACAEAARHGQADIDSMRACDSALATEDLDPRDFAGTFVNRAILEMIQRDYVRARMDLDHAIGIQPRLGAAWANRGAVSLGQHRYQEALADINKGLELGVEEAEKVYFNRALVYEGLDDEHSAYFDFEQAATLSPNWDLPKQELLRFTVTRP